MYHSKQPQYNLAQQHAREILQDNAAPTVRSERRQWSPSEPTEVIGLLICSNSRPMRFHLPSVHTKSRNGPQEFWRGLLRQGCLLAAIISYRISFENLNAVICSGHV